MAGSDELFPDHQDPNGQVPTPILQVPKDDEWKKQQEVPKPEHSEQPSPVHDLCGCIPVSVKGDATYCVTGPVCAGDGQTPTGTSCPKKSEKATDSCNGNLPSSRDGDCYAPKDAQCQNPEGTWMCVYPDDMPQAGKEIPFVQPPIPVDQPIQKVPDQAAKPPAPVAPDHVEQQPENPKDDIPDQVVPQPKNPKEEIPNPPSTPQPNNRKEEIPDQVMPPSKPIQQKIPDQASPPSKEQFRQLSLVNDGRLLSGLSKQSLPLIDASKAQLI